MKNHMLTLAECKQIIDKIYDMRLFKRVNLAGGEPMMCPYLQEIIDYVVSKGLLCSIITNGSLLSESFVKENQKKISMIGISVDSMDEAMNQQIGRKTISNLTELCKAIKKEEITLKVNLCINRLNLNYDFRPILSDIKPDRLKIFQMVPTPHSSVSQHLRITKEEFNDFCRKLYDFNPICEDNDFMTSAYWIVDSEVSVKY